MPTLPQKAAADKPGEVDWAAALQAEMLTVVRQAIEHLVGAELAAVLGPPYARAEARVGYRHGSKVRTITSPVGAVTLTVPRARLQAGTSAATEWQSQVVPAYARRMRQVNEAVRQAYLCGANTRRIRGALTPLLQGRALSKSAISRIVQGLKAPLEAWRMRAWRTWISWPSYLDGFHLRVRLGGRVSPVPVLAVLGVQRSGQKVLVHRSLRGSESTDAWAAVCEDLAARGVRAPQLCVLDGSKGLRAAVERTWPAAAIQRCTVHKLRNLLTHAPRRLHDELRDDYHAIVFAVDGESHGARTRPSSRSGARAARGRRRVWRKPGPSCSPSSAIPRASGRAGARRIASNPLPGVPTSGEDARQFPHSGCRPGPALRPRGLGADLFPETGGLVRSGSRVRDTGPDGGGRGRLTPMASIAPSHNWLRIASDGATHIRVSPQLGHCPRSKPNVLRSPRSLFHIIRDTANPWKLARRSWERAW
jgi:putative transposase